MALPQHLSTDDLVKFRTRFCERFLQFGECNFGCKCQYSHNMTWRRRSPQKYLYEPRLCDNIISYTADNGCRRHCVVNCHNGKNCKFAHSREEILYHPVIYKTVLCEDMNCSKYYCPFAHSIEELLPTNETPEYIKRCLQDVMDIDENDTDLLDDDVMGESDIVLMDNGLRMRKASGISGSPLLGSNPSPFASSRVHLPVPGSADWNVQDASAWVQISAGIQVETIVRASSPVVGSELCRAMISRADTTGLAAKKVITQSIPNQYCLAKVMQLGSSQDYSQLVSDLTAIAKTEHRNLLSIKKVHVGAMTGSSQQILCVAIEQCSTSLHQAIIDGYRNGGDVATIRGLAKKMNPHNGTTSLTAIQRISDMISGLQRLHFIGISHLRLCPTNILIDNEACFKLADFLGKAGLIQSVDEKNPPKSYLSDQVLMWLSPEVIQFTQKKKSFKHNVLGKKADIFSLGCVIFYSMTGQHPFGNSDTVVDNVLSDYVSNQHLLYMCPLVLDLCFRTICLNPDERMDVSEMSRHPLFWDFDFTKSFITGLDLSNEIMKDFLNYDLPWVNFVSSVLNSTQGEMIVEAISELLRTEEYPETIFGIVRFLLDSWNVGVIACKKSGSSVLSNYAPPSPAMMAPVSGLWLKILDTYPQVLIRLWDASKLVSIVDKELWSKKRSELDDSIPSPQTTFKRNHLHWMCLRTSAITSVSHNFVREYYAAINSLLFKASDFPTTLSFPDESIGLADSVVAHISGLVSKASSNKSGGFFLQDRKNSSISFGTTRKQLIPHRSPPITPVVSSWNPVDAPTNASSNTTPVAGMKFVDPAIVKQMAAASAALSAVYDNPELVNAITKGDPTIHNQLIATATIYESLLNNADCAGALSGIKW
jgi:serine/threonine protein kinase